MGKQGEMFIGPLFQRSHVSSMRRSLFQRSCVSIMREPLSKDPVFQLCGNPFPKILGFNYAGDETVQGEGTLNTRRRYFEYKEKVL
jgi:hypothetical protein